ncbi:hypothetical protein QCA50_015114 [Cerrena zonata]|uniref:F-box domain-containing protein n=1 Tax=Cerrena zonata TaxID=2478898 RepID=A0AAW0FR62_9APHY
MIEKDDSRSYSILPIEVIERIIDFCSMRIYSTKTAVELLEDPRKVLMACALSCRALLPRSRYNLFRHVELSGDAPSKALIHTLRTNKNCALNVRVLEITDS